MWDLYVTVTPPIFLLRGAPGFKVVRFHDELNVGVRNEAQVCGDNLSRVRVQLL